MGQRRAEAERAAEHERLRLYVRGALLCFVWSFVGLFGVAYGMHTTDYAVAIRAFGAGLIAGNIGILWTVVRTAQQLDAVDG